MKKKLISVGFFSELKHGRPEGGSLRASLQPAAGPDDARLVAYLRGGKRLTMAPGPVRDVLAANAIIGTLEILTDGTYAWPSDLAHYIERHHAAAPVALLEHARANDFVLPAVDVSTIEL
jgi:hypothetical protein